MLFICICIWPAASFFPKWSKNSCSHLNVSGRKMSVGCYSKMGIGDIQLGASTQETNALLLSL